MQECDVHHMQYTKTFQTETYLHPHVAKQMQPIAHMLSR